jgi:hypothetical protein
MAGITVTSRRHDCDSCSRLDGDIGMPRETRRASSSRPVPMTSGKAGCASSATSELRRRLARAKWPRPERKRLRESPRGCDPWPPRPRRNFAGYSKWHGRSARQWSPERTPRLYAHARHQRTVLRIWEGPALRHRRDARPSDRLSNGAKGTDDPARTSPAPSGAGRAGHQQAGGPTAARGESAAQTVKGLSIPIKRTVAARLQ